MIWVAWGLLLLAQNASFTLVSRARNSSSIWYHTWASMLSNGVWFVAQLFLLDNMLHILKSGNWKDGLVVALFYTACTMVGSIGMHYIALHKIERAKKSE